MDSRKSKVLKDIAALLREYEDPSGHNCSNDACAEVWFNFGKERYIWTGDEFEKKGKGKKA